MARRNSVSCGMGGMGRVAYNRLPYAGKHMIISMTGGRMGSVGYMGEVDESITDMGNSDTANQYYTVAMQEVPSGNGANIMNPMTAGPGTTAYPGGSSLDVAKQLLQQAGTAAQTVVGIQNMQNLQKLNQQLVLMGKPPLTASQVASLTTPVNVGLTPDVMNMLLIGGIALLAVMAIKH